MKRYTISWKTKDARNSVEIIAPTFTKALNYCQTKIEGFVCDNVTSVYVYDDVIIAE